MLETALAAYCFSAAQTPHMHHLFLSQEPGAADGSAYGPLGRPQVKLSATGSHLKAPLGRLFPNSPVLPWLYSIPFGLWIVGLRTYMAVGWGSPLVPCPVGPPNTETCFIKASKGENLLARWKLHSLVI